jgi:predicted RNA binding protein YcfA (HicA-like mRNA interferase family)
MPRLRVLSGTDLIRIFSRFGFAQVSQKGSYAKLKRKGPHAEDQTLVVPMHQELDRGTLRAIFNQACRYIRPSDLERHFFSE